jgi:hypothetical protein
MISSSLIKKSAKTKALLLSAGLKKGDIICLNYDDSSILGILTKIRIMKINGPDGFECPVIKLKPLAIIDDPKSIVNNPTKYF